MHPVIQASISTWGDQAETLPATAWPFVFFALPYQKKGGSRELCGGAVLRPTFVLGWQVDLGVTPRGSAPPAGCLGWCLTLVLGTLTFSLARNGKFLQKDCLVVSCPHLVPTIIIVPSRKDRRKEGKKGGRQGGKYQRHLSQIQEF